MAELVRDRSQGIDCHLPGMFRCPSCSIDLPYTQEAIHAYFARGGHLECPNCHREADLWQVILNAVRNNFPMLGGVAPALLGAEGVILVFAVEAGEIFTLPFEQYGLPRDARIISLNYTPTGRVMPVELHGNQPLREFPRAVTLYVRPVGQDAPATTEISIALTWLPPHGEGTWFNSSLVSAFEAYSQNRYLDLIVPANVAVETEVVRLMTDFLRPSVARRNLDRFLSDDATYGGQLNVLLPALAHRLGVPLMPDAVRGALNRLRTLRNDLAHHGHLDAQFGRNEAAECLCGAFFGVHYANFARPLLLQPAGA